MAKKLVALTVVDVAEMFNGAFPFRQGGLNLSNEASCLKAALFGVFDKLCGYLAIMCDAVASVAEELETAEITDALAAALYLIVENFMHTQVIAVRLIILPPITDFAKSQTAQHAQLFPSEFERVASGHTRVGSSTCTMVTLFRGLALQFKDGLALPAAAPNIALRRALGCMRFYPELGSFPMSG